MKGVPFKRRQISVTLGSVTFGKTALFIVNIQNGNETGCMDLYIENFLQIDIKMSFLIQIRCRISEIKFADKSVDLPDM